MTGGTANGPAKPVLWKLVAGAALAGVSIAAVRTASGRPLRSAGTVAAGVVGLASASLMVYQALTPRSWLYGEVFWGAKTDERVVALTFDDGPCHPYTEELLDFFEDEGIKATFFMPGMNVRREPELAAKVARAGHAIGNHTFTHPHLTWRSEAFCRREMLGGQEEILAATGTVPELFRVPHGWYGPQVIRAAESLGMRCVGWSVMAWDWNKPPAPTIEGRIMRGIGPGGVSLLHDGQDTDAYPTTDRSRSVAAVREIVARLKTDGYRFVTLPELMKLSH